MNEFLSHKILDNSIKQYAWFFGILLIVFLFKRYISGALGAIIYNFFRRYTKENRVKQFNALIFRPASWLIILFAASLSFQILIFPSAWVATIFNYPLKTCLSKLLVTIIAIVFTWVLLRVIDFITILLRDRALHTESKMDDQLIPFIKDILKIIVALISAGFILGGILNFNIAGILTGLGIGGLALALAAQDTLSNLFGSLTIFLDRPFTVGDIVKVGDVTGKVEKVGFRSTRLRTTDKTFVTIPNKKMTDSSVDNLTLRTYRRVNMVIGLSYETSTLQLRNIIGDIQKYFDGREEMNEDNFVRFDSFGESAINLMVEYYVPQTEYLVFMKIKEEINFYILETIQSNGSKIAHPIRIMQEKKI